MAVLVTPFAPPDEATYPPSITIAGLPLSVPKILYSELLYVVFTELNAVVPDIACPTQSCHWTG